MEKARFPKIQKKEKQVLSLLAQVDNALNATSGVTNSLAKQVDTTVSSLLLAENQK